MSDRFYLCCNGLQELTDIEELDLEVRDLMLLKKLEAPKKAQFLEFLPQKNALEIDAPQLKVNML